MNDVIRQISDLVNRASHSETDFLDILFGSHKQEVLDGRPVILFGAGIMGGGIMQHS